MQYVKILTTHNIEIEYEIASLGDRILSQLIDRALMILLVIALLVSGSFLNVLFYIHKSIYWIIVLFVMATFCFYSLICEVFWNGQSIGKYFMKIRVISADGEQGRLSQYLARWAFRLIDIVLSSAILGITFISSTEKRQRLGDIVGNTLVIKTNPRTNLGMVAFNPTPVNYIPKFSEVIHMNNRDAELIFEVLRYFYKNRNANLIHTLYRKVTMHFNLVAPSGMNELQFLEALLQDYKLYSVRDSR